MLPTALTAAQAAPLSSPRRLHSMILVRGIHANAVLEVKTWDEKPYQEIEGGSKLTRASVTKAYRGDISGDATSESLMFYRADGSAVFAGLERVVGSIGGRAGSFVLQV